MLIKNHTKQVGDEFPNYGIEHFDMLTDDEKWHYVICADWRVYDESNPFIHYPLELTDSQRKLYEKFLQRTKNHNKLLLLKYRK